MTVNSSLDRAESQINELSQTIGKRSEAAADEMAADWNQWIADLRDERMEIRNELENIAVETGAAFDESKQELEKRVNELEAEITEARLASIEAREEFSSAAQHEIEVIDGEFNDLETRVQEAEASARLALDETLAQLRAERAELSVRWDSLSTVTDAEYREMRRDIAGAIGRLDRKLSEAARAIEQELQS